MDVFRHALRGFGPPSLAQGRVQVLMLRERQTERRARDKALKHFFL